MGVFGVDVLERFERKNGHEFSEENTKLTTRGRVCITCARTRAREWAKKKRSK